MQKTLLGLDQLQNYLIRGFSILITLIIYGLGFIRANLMKVNPLKRSKISTLIKSIKYINKEQYPLTRYQRKMLRQPIYNDMYKSPKPKKIEK